MLLTLLLLSCVNRYGYRKSDLSYKTVQESPFQELILQKGWDELTINGGFKGISSNDTITVYIHQPNDTITKHKFVQNYYLELKLADYYHIYFVTKTGRTKRLTVDNCEEVAFSLYTNVDFRYAKNHVLVTSLSPEEKPRIINQTVRTVLRYQDIVKKERGG